jgi:uncharacterized protein YodC (DUF2158 family)
MAFKIGDIVQLKSGGPKMTVITAADSNGRVYTSWFAGAKNERNSFPESALELPPQEDKNGK